jgi:kynurenine formamidase
MTATTIGRAAAVAALTAALTGMLSAQTREKGPWWPAPHGPKDQAGNSNYVTPEKILKALRIPKTGQTYELGHIYERTMPQYGDRPYFLSVQPAAPPQKEGAGSVHRDYFTGFIGQMGTQFDAFGHQGQAVRMADGAVKSVYYNGFTEEELTGTRQGVDGLEALGVEHVKPIITRGILVDVAGYKGVPVLDSRYEVTMADVRGALTKQGIAEAGIEAGDAILFNYGWAVNWSSPQKYNDSRFFVGENNGSPGIGLEVARWLVSKRASMAGADSCCVQAQPEVTPGPRTVHHELLNNGVLMLENMDLRELARDRVYEFLYLNLTERIKGATGSPVRPVAVR